MNLINVESCVLSLLQLSTALSFGRIIYKKVAIRPNIYMDQSVGRIRI